MYENEALAIGHQWQLGGRSPRRSRRLPGSMLWREIAVGLSVATIGITLALYVVAAGMVQPRIAQPSPLLALSHRLDTTPTVGGPSLTPPL